MPFRSQFPGTPPETPESDHLRQGTREQFESEWRLIPGGHAEEFQHDLGELPLSVHVAMSEVAGGTFPKDGTSSVIVALTDEDSIDGSGERILLVTSGLAAGTDRYFKVRAT